MEYNKQALDTPDLLAILKQRGLVITNEQEAIKKLSVISYFRLACYFRPMEADRQTHVFRQNTTLEQVMVLCEYWLNSIDQNNTFVADFKSLLAKNPTVDVAAMGFPKDWKQEPLWQ